MLILKGIKLHTRTVLLVEITRLTRYCYYWYGGSVATMPNPASGSLRTPPAIQHAVIAKRAVGDTKRKIARELGIARKTVDAILDGSPVEQPDYTAIVHSKLIPKALTRVEQVIDSDTDTARYVLDNTIFRRESGSSYTVGGDLHVQTAIGLLPTGTTSTPSSASTAMTTSTAGTDAAVATEAAAKPPGSDMSLSLHPNFSNFSDEQLEQELARRRSARVVDAEVIG